jgi:hypothetical protein
MTKSIANVKSTLVDAVAFCRLILTEQKRKMLMEDICKKKQKKEASIQSIICVCSLLFVFRINHINE